MSPVLPITEMGVWCYVRNLERLISSHNNRDRQGRISSAARVPQGVNRAVGTIGDKNIQDFPEMPRTSGAWISSALQSALLRVKDSVTCLCGPC